MWQKSILLSISISLLKYFDLITKRSTAELPLKAGLIALCEHGKYSWVYPVRMSPAFNGISVLERLKCGNAIEICNGIMFDFYPELPQIQSSW